MTQPAPGPAPVPLDAIKRIVAQLSCLETKWSSEARGVLGAAGGPQAWILLTLTQDARPGPNTDEYQQVYDPTADQLVNTVGGYRLVKINARASSIEFSQQPTDALERVRWGLETVNGRDALIAAGLAYVRTEAIAAYRSKGTNRDILNASMDITLSRLAVAVATNDPGDYIETVDAPGGVPFTGS